MSESSRQLATGADQAPKRPRWAAIGIQGINQMIIIINVGRRSTGGTKERGRGCVSWNGGGEKCQCIGAHKHGGKANPEGKGFGVQTSGSSGDVRETKRFEGQDEPILVARHLVVHRKENRGSQSL